MINTLKTNKAVQLAAFCGGLTILNLDLGIHAAVFSLVCVTAYGFYQAVK